ncbi:cytochrome P450 [Filobasidium floriforme]|uniref:cytochrome P450 n=1 Tax=Filobasidium floriforme TaxID=5210 RepID=UPI001E8EAEDE|nr:cytochrome P450 [Filobasidium floriforme]KAH8084791.1 cytochrome P450 [Filobasidium floriforme]
MLLLGAVVLLLILLFRTVYHQRAKAFRPLPLVGHFTWFAAVSRQKSLEWLKRASDYHQGKSWKLELPLIGQAWVLEDPACVKHVLSTRHDAFAKGELATSRLADLFGDGIILTNGNTWKVQRSAGHAAFANPINLKYFVDRILPKHLDKLFGELDSAAETGGHKGKVVDLQEVAYDYAMSVFGELAYDSNFGKISSSFAGPFDRAAIQTHERFFNPLYRITEFILPSGARLRKDIRDVKMFGDELVREGRDRLRREEEGLDSEDEDEKDKQGKGILLEELVKERGRDDQVRFLADSCLNFLTAGRDTTAQALSWTIYLLLLNPKTKENVFNEVMASVQPREAVESTSLADLISSTSPTAYCPYANAVISEALRLHPPVPLEIHENVTDEAIALPDGTAVYPGEKVVWGPWVMSRSTRIWGEDAEEYRPERWLAPAYWDPEAKGQPLPKDHAARKTAFEFPVFHAGPRSCLGKQLARIELVFALRELMLRFDFSPAWQGSVIYRTNAGSACTKDAEDDEYTGTLREIGDGLTGPIKDGLPVRVRRRQKTQ